jgi:hypothetical protein
MTRITLAAVRRYRMKMQVTIARGAALVSACFGHYCSEIANPANDPSNAELSLTLRSKSHESSDTLRPYTGDSIQLSIRFTLPSLFDAVCAILAGEKPDTLLCVTT